MTGKLLTTLLTWLLLSGPAQAQSRIVTAVGLGVTVTGVIFIFRDAEPTIPQVGGGVAIMSTGVTLVYLGTRRPRVTLAPLITKQVKGVSATVRVGR